MGGGQSKRLKNLEQEVRRLRGASIVQRPLTPRHIECYAIYIAIDKYQYLEDLQSSIKDAEALRRRLEPRYTTLGTLYNRQVTLINILTLFDQCKDQLAQSRLVIFFAGHGEHMSSCGRSFFACYASTTHNLISTALDLSSIRSFCDYFNSEHQLWLLDCCFSGSALRYRGLMNSPSLYIMSAGRSMQTALETKDHGVFTASLLKHWEDGLPVTKLFTKIRQDVMRTSQQIPMLGRVPKHRDRDAEGEMTL